MAMRMDVATALTKSAEAFRVVVWPAIRDELGGGEIVPVESVTSTGFKKTLDVEAGVDAWQIVTDAGIRAVASRVQSGADYRTFTIRYSTRSGSRTEIDKRIDAIRDGYLYPTITVQAYVECPHHDQSWLIDRCVCPTWTDHNLVSVGYVDTVVLYEFAAFWRDRHGSEEELWRTRDGACVKDVPGGNRMLVVPWHLLEDCHVVEPATRAA